MPLIRPSTTRSTIALWAKSLLNAALFFSVFMVALPAAVGDTRPARLLRHLRPRQSLAVRAA